MCPMRPWFLLLFLSFISFFCHSQCNSQNHETFYPSNTHPQNPTPLSPPSSSSPTQNPSSNKTVVKAVVATAVSTFAVALLLFFFVRRHHVTRRKQMVAANGSSGGGERLPSRSSRFQSLSFKGMVIDENGLDVLYWRKLDEANKSCSFKTDIVHRSDNEEEEEVDNDDDENVHVDRRQGQAIHGRKKPEPVQEIPLLRGKSSASQNKIVPEISSPDRIMAQPVNGDIEKPNLSGQTSNHHLPPPPAPPLPLPPARRSLMAVPANQGHEQPLPPPPPPTPLRKNNSTPPPPPPPLPEKKNISTPAPPPPPPPPVPGKKGNAIATPLPPPPPGAAAKQTEAGTSGRGGSSSGGDATGNGNGQVKLKPLHWDKVNKNTDHSMVWDKIGGGSFRFDDDLMEALFGCVATNRKSPKKERPTGDSSSNQATEPTILDPRKSQNIAIVLKSLGISRTELVEALAEGKGLNAETLERLMRIVPTKEEESQLLEFNGDIMTLSDAESFLYHLLKAVPSAFTRANAMLFQLNYDSEILQYKESLQTLELGCKELRNRGLFVKLLEATLKAGNRMNAGTSRGNAQAFDLASLQKLSDVKSTDGKTTLLHFIVVEVVRSEGKRCVINRNHSFNRSISSSSSNRSSSSSNTGSENSFSVVEDKEREYKMLGLPIVGGLSAEFSNVKKAAQLDYDSFSGTYSALTARIAEVRSITLQCEANGEGRFSNKMKGFIEAAEEELKILTEEEKKIMELVQKTTEYYQAGASKKKGAQPFQLFVIIRDFLGMVDKVCVEIARNLQRKKPASSKFGSSPKSPRSRTPVKFANLPEHFMKDKSSSSSSESDDEF